MNIQEKSASISGDGEFTDPIEAKKDFNLSISGTWTGTITLQRRFGNAGAWLDVEAFTANAEKKAFEPESNVFYRLGFDTGGFTNGAALVRVSR